MIEPATQPAWRNWIPLQKCLLCPSVIWQGFRWGSSVLCKTCGEGVACRSELQQRRAS